MEKEINKEQIAEFLCKMMYVETWTPETHKQIYKEGELEKSILSGYWYRLGAGSEPEEGKRRVMANTRAAGVKQYIKIFKEEGIENEDFIASGIEVFVDGQWVRLTDKRLHHDKKNKAKKSSPEEEAKDTGTDSAG